MPDRPTYALSIKQPWAALLVAGRKTVEVRKWATTVRGPVYIHAAGAVDDRPDGWAQLSGELLSLSNLRGGLLGTADLCGCVMYATPAAFALDGLKHLNPLDWFEQPRMYGFKFRHARVVPFARCRGSVRFFSVAVPEMP
ncbi:MAG TPA: ASCH domain-containing protein [Gemmataceae bacterium]|nr:ASCH domain-containing protein [Gemmataceae bacterium]